MYNDFFDICSSELSDEEFIQAVDSFIEAALENV